jgi:hypothetical protein
LYSLARTVGNNPDPVSLVIGAKGACGNTVPSSKIPERSEAPENFFQSARAKGRNVFDDDPLGVRLFDETQVLEPESGALSAQSGALSGDGNILARWAAAEHVWLLHVAATQLGDVLVGWHPWEALLQHGVAGGVDFAETDRSETPCSGKPEGEVPDP